VTTHWWACCGAGSWPAEISQFPTWRSRSWEAHHRVAISNASVLVAPAKAFILMPKGRCVMSEPHWLSSLLESCRVLKPEKVQRETAYSFLASVPEMNRVQNDHNNDNDHCNGNGNCGRPAAVPDIILPAKAVLIGRRIFVRHRVPSYLARPPAVCGGLLLQPSFYHGTSVKFGILPRSIKGLCSRLDASGMNGGRPQIRLDPCTNSVADAWMLHDIILRPNPKLYNVRRDGCSGFRTTPLALGSAAKPLIREANIVPSLATNKLRGIRLRLDHIARRVEQAHVRSAPRRKHSATGTLQILR